MNVKWMEPPAWWVKWKPLRWLLAIVVLYWFFGTLMPRLREDPPLPAVPVAVESESAAEPIDTPVPPVQQAEPDKPAVVVPAPPKPAAPAPAPPKPAAAVAEARKPAAAPPIEKQAPVATTSRKSEMPAQADMDLVKEEQPASPYTTVETTRVELINGLRSYESLESIQATLAQAGFASVLSTINKDTHGGRYPPYRSDTLVVAKYQHANIEGRLTLEFFNDRLYQSHFVPQQPTDYLQWLRTHGTPLPKKRTGRSSLTRGDLEITTNIDFAVTEVGTLMGTQPYVQWTDARLNAQMRDWGPIP